MADREKIDLVLDWADDHPEFDASFVESLEVYLDNRPELTQTQREALDNIIARWRIGSDGP